MGKAFAAFGISVIYILCVLCVRSVAGNGSEGGAAVTFFSKLASSAPVSRESIVCLNRKGNCAFPKKLQCPLECPQRKPKDEKTKACFADCGPKCETSCKVRVRGCNGYGSICYDPRFVGGDGVMFYFHGARDDNFCLVSDTNLHINAHMIGTRPPGRKRDYTWLQTLGILFSLHKLTVGATSNVPAWNDAVDHLNFTFDGRAFAIPENHEALWASPDGAVTIERTARRNSAIVRLKGTAEISVRVVPITPQEDRVHNYQLPPDDCFAHLDLRFDFVDLSDIVDGVLGQTYRPNFVNPVKRGVPMPVMGGEDRYRTSSLLSTDCRSCTAFGSHRISNNKNRGAALKMPASTCSGNFESQGGIVCRK